MWAADYSLPLLILRKLFKSHEESDLHFPNFKMSSFDASDTFVFNKYSRGS